MKNKLKLFFLIITFAFLFQAQVEKHIISPTLFTHKNHESVMDTLVMPRLTAKENTYILQKPNNFIPQAEASDVGEYIHADSYAAIDFESGDVVMEKNLQKRLPIASLTKIMTAVVALDLSSEDEYFTVTKKASEQIPTKIGVVEGQKMNVSELLHAVLLTSANDAAAVLKDGISEKYGEDVFIKAMNEKAKFIGLKNTSFENPQGFDSRTNYSTSEDLAILSHYALKNYPLISEIVAKDYAFLPEDVFHKQFDLYNWNGLIGVYPNTTGIKIGSTERAGKTTVVVSEREGKKILAVLLNAPGVLERDGWAAQLLDAAFLKTMNLPAVEISQYELQKKYDSWY